ncbi:MAG: hypothetical protein KatS3mg105_3024 [Gemmatales bacterium]|nr:MAG: hypothetical protein KatS3mg105_3024 [Gemmatales bacterium]
MSKKTTKTRHADRSDSSLFRHVKAGEQSAATELYYRYYDRLKGLVQTRSSSGLAQKVDADDIIQSVFGSFFRGMNLGYYDVPSGGELWNLFLVIALNKIRAKGIYFQAAKRDLRRTRGGELLERVSEGRDEDASRLLRMTIAEVLASLPKLDAQVITLRVQGCEVAEIAASVGRSKRSVERILQSFRKKLARSLEE